MPYLQGTTDVDFTATEAKEVLESVELNSFSGEMNSLPPVGYKSRDVFVFRLKHAKDTDWKGDVRGVEGTLLPHR